MSVTVSAVSGIAGPADYSGLPATVTFADGQTTASVVVTLVNDTVAEGDETLSLELDGIPLPAGLLTR